MINVLLILLLLHQTPASRIDLTLEAQQVNSTDDYYLTGDYPFNVRLTMSSTTSDLPLKFQIFQLQDLFTFNYKAHFGITTDGSPWGIYGFDSVESSIIAIDVTVPDPDQKGLYTVDLMFVETGVRGYIQGVQVMEISTEALDEEVEGWDTAVSDLAINLQPLPTSLFIQVRRRRHGTSISEISDEGPTNGLFIS